MRKHLLLSTLFMLPSVAFSSVDDVPTDRQIVGVQVYAAAAMVQISPAFADFQGCTQSGSGWLVIDLNTDKSLFSAVLAGAMAKQKMGFGLSGCGGGQSEYPTIKRVDMAY